ncbi:MAG: tetratricopeptide repeat protein [Treponema sp.]|nr:tetratricopeptide repeat protein [Treponema sp.]
MSDELIKEIDFPDQAALDEQGTEVSKYSKLGYQLLKENRVDEAKEAFSKILLVDENNNYALVGLGDCERKSNNIQKAVDFYNKCLSFHPGNNYALFGLADCYKAQGKFGKAIEIWERYLKIDNYNIAVLTRVADAYRKVKDFQKSRKFYMDVLELEKDNPYALIGLGHLHYDFKDYKSALYYWMCVYEKTESSADIRVLTAIGNCYRNLKNFSQGIKFFDMALSVEPENFYALFGLADCYRGLNQQDKSIIYWNKILDIDPNNKIILTRVGDAYRKLGKYQIAKDFYNRAMSIDFDIYAAIGLALILKDEGCFHECIKQFSDLIRNDPKNYRLYLDLSDCYMKMNDRDKAIDTLKSYSKSGLRSTAISEKLYRLENERRGAV